jgi:hypothetical protein
MLPAGQRPLPDWNSDIPRLTNLSRLSPRYVNLVRASESSGLMSPTTASYNARTASMKRARTLRSSPTLFVVCGRPCARTPQKAGTLLQMLSLTCSDEVRFLDILASEIHPRATLLWLSRRDKPKNGVVERSTPARPVHGPFEASAPRARPPLPGYPSPVTGPNVP